MGTTTTTFALNKPTVGGDDNAWGGDWNSNADKLDDLLDGTTGITPNLISGWEVGGVAVTSTAAELNQLDTNTFTADITIPDKIIHAGDTNTAIRFPADDTVTVETSGAERLRVDSAGNLGLGVTPSAWNSAGRAIELGRVGSSMFSFQGSGSGAILTSNAFYNGGSWKYANTDAATTYETGEGKHRWFVAPSGTAGNAITFTQAMTLDASGNLLVGTTSNLDGNRLNVVQTSPGASAGFQVYANDAGAINWYNATGGYVAAVTVGASSVSYNTSSDYRLKENVQPMQDALAVIAQLNPVTYTWKVDGSDGQGFIAHELQAVVPDCVTGEKDAVDAKGNPKYQGVDTSFLVATLVKALQEQQVTIENLTARITALEA
jgi:hypothetical protein